MGCAECKGRGYVDLLTSRQPCSCAADMREHDARQRADQPLADAARLFFAHPSSLDDWMRAWGRTHRAGQIARAGDRVPVMVDGTVCVSHRDRVIPVRITPDTRVVTTTSDGDTTARIGDCLYRARGHEAVLDIVDLMRLEGLEAWSQDGLVMHTPDVAQAEHTTARVTARADSKIDSKVQQYCEARYAGKKRTCDNSGNLLTMTEFHWPDLRVPEVSLSESHNAISFVRMDLEYTFPREGALVAMRSDGAESARCALASDEHMPIDPRMGSRS